MLITDVKRVIEQVSREKGINREVLVATLKEAIESAAKKKLGARADIEVHYDERTGEVEVFQFKEVVTEIEDLEVELTLEDGLKYDPECEEGDSLGIRLETSQFGRIAAQAAKQVIIQKMKEAERNAVYENFIHKKGEILNGIIQRVDRGNIIVNLGQAEALLSTREQMPREHYRRGDRIRAYVLDVLEVSRGAQIILSRTHSEFLVKLFASEVPEVAESIVTIQGAAREPGIRSKVAVSSSDSDVDPVGACVGMKGNRVQNIVQELRGEKIDIVQWNPDVAKFVCNALAPAEIAKVVIDEENRVMEIVVPDEFLSIAIGKNGQNVRLACRLTGWHLDVMSQDEYGDKLNKIYSSFMRISSMTMDIAATLYSNGFTSLKEISEAYVSTLTSILEISEEEASFMRQTALELLHIPVSNYGNEKELKLGLGNDLNDSVEEDGTDKNEDSGAVENDDIDTDKDADVTEEDSTDMNEDSGAVENDDIDTDKDADVTEEDGTDMNEDSGAVENDDIDTDKDADAAKEDATDMNEGTGVVENNDVDTDKDADAVEDDVADAVEDAE